MVEGWGRGLGVAVWLYEGELEGGSGRGLRPSLSCPGGVSW